VRKHLPFDSYREKNPGELQHDEIRVGGERLIRLAASQFAQHFLESGIPAE